MNELRKDYILNRSCIVSEARGKRPHDFVKSQKLKASRIDYFALGNEHLTPPEKYRLGGFKRWRVRVFNNKFSAVTKEGQKTLRTDNGFYTFANAIGEHEVLVETPSKKKDLADLSKKQIIDVLKTYSNRIIALEKQSGVCYVQIFKNKGSDAGTSLVHSHSQIIAYNQIPPLVEEKLNCSIKDGNCLYCEIIKKEQDSYRCIVNSKYVSAFTPYCSITPYHAMIFPKKHITRLSDFKKNDFEEIASAIKMILSKLASINAPYNMFMHYSPKGENMHLHFEILPRLTTWAGFELATGTYIIPVSPENAAAYYRGEV